MSDAKDKKDSTLSVGAKTYVEGLAKEHVYGFTSSVSTKEMQKGLIVENDSIALLNDVLFADYTKNTLRKENDWIGGTADIFTGYAIHDVKSSWSLNTFPATKEQAEDTLYEWQVRGYMFLWDVDEAEVDHCLVDTPDELISPWEAEAVHKVTHIEPLLRVTRVPVKRDRERENKIKAKVEAAQKYFVQAIETIHSNHN